MLTDNPGLADNPGLTDKPGLDDSPGPIGVAGRLCLAVTSSTSVVGVAVGRAGADGAEVVHHQIETDRRHAEELTPLLARILQEVGLSLADIGCFAVDVGPGRFTGLRVGLATVRTLALVTGHPVVALTSLEILAAGEPDRPVLAVIDARRGEVFQQRFDADGPTGPPEVGPAADLAPGVGDRPGPETAPSDAPLTGAGRHRTGGVGLVVVGDGADRYPERYGDGLRPGRQPSAAVMVTLAGSRPARPGHQVAPLYLRDPDVHINVKTRHTPR